MQSEASSVSDDLGMLICWSCSTVVLKSKFRAAVYKGTLLHFSDDKHYGDANFVFQQELTPAQTAKSTNNNFNDWGVHRVEPDLNPLCFSRGRWQRTETTMQTN